MNAGYVHQVLKELLGTGHEARWVDGIFANSAFVLFSCISGDQRKLKYI